MRFGLALAMLLACCGSSQAGEIRTGAIMQVKPDAIWFQDKATLRHWQRLVKAGDIKALTSYQEGLLSSRDAWQFIRPITIKIRGYRSVMHQVDVEMQNEGRLRGTRWVLDADAVVVRYEKSPT